VPYLHDTANTWLMQPDGQYLQIESAQPVSAQQALAAKHTLLASSKPVSQVESDRGR
jgi:hypothetical protein